MKSTFKYGASVRCDMATVVDTPDDLLFNDQCEEKFVTGSVPYIVRVQASGVGFVRVKANHVKWPGLPPVGKPGAKVDLCPQHASCVMTADEYKAAKIAAREVRKAERKNKPRAPRKKKEAPTPTTTEATT